MHNGLCDYPKIKAIIGGQRFVGILIDGGLQVKVISMAVCRYIEITKWELCKILMRMANGSLVQSIGMTPNLEMVMQGHVFTNFIVIMDLQHKVMYPILLGQP
jgi:hypothetical protein